MSTHVVEVGPKVIRQLCCGGDVVASDEMVRVAFDSIDDPVALVDLRPVTVSSLWRTVLGSVDCGSPEHAIVVHPSWWAPRRIDVVGSAARVFAGEVVLRPRSWLLRQACPPESRPMTVVVEIADCFVVVTGAKVAAETRRGEPQPVVDAVVRCILEMTSDATAAVVIDAPTAVVEAGALAAMLAESVQATGAIDTVRVVGAAQLKRCAAQFIREEDRTGESPGIEAPGRDCRRHWRPVLIVLLTIAMLGIFGTLAPARRDARTGDSFPTTLLVEGSVVLQVPAAWPTQRVLAGPGSARVQVTSPSDPEMSLHVTQSRVAIAALSATAEFLRQAIDAEPTGVFVDFNPAGSSAGRPAVTYREVRPGHDVRWTVLVDKAVRISIGCQSRHGHEEAMLQVCDLAVRSARALT